MLVPLVFLIAANSTFFAMLLNDLLKQKRGVPTAVERGGFQPRAVPPMLPTDYGFLCLAFVTWGWFDVFAVLYALFALAAVVFWAAALTKWFRDMRGRRRPVRREHRPGASPTAIVRSGRDAARRGQLRLGCLARTEPWRHDASARRRSGGRGDRFTSVPERERLVRAASRHGWRAVLLDDNRGFGGGVNAGAALASDLGSDVIATLNPDATIDAASLERLIDHARAHPDALVSPRIVGSLGTTWFEGADLSP